MVEWKEDAILLDFFVYIGHDSHILIFCGKICITGRISWQMTRNVQVIFHQKGNHIYMYMKPIFSNIMAALSTIWDGIFSLMYYV